MKAYKLYINNHLIDIFTECIERSYLKPSKENLNKEEYLRTYSNYEYSLNIKEVKNYFLSRFSEKGKLDNVDIDEVNKMLSKSSAGSSMQHGIGYHIDQITFSGQFRLQLSVSKFLDLEIGKTVTLNDKFSLFLKCVEIN